MSIAVITKRADFVKTTKNGIKIVCRPFILFILEDEQLEETAVKFGLTVSSKIGNAVERNRVKRRLRHLVTNLIPKFGLNKTMICIVAKRQSYYLEFSTLEREFVNGIKKYTKGSF